MDPADFGGVGGFEDDEASSGESGCVSTNEGLWRDELRLCLDEDHKFGDDFGGSGGGGMS
jgi:hypothetical protein